MPGITPRPEEHIEGALRRFKKQCEKAGVIKEFRAREFYDKPSVRKKRKSKLARSRAAKRRAYGR
jgi:small subunit ribosomal protein S21